MPCFLPTKHFAEGVSQTLLPELAIVVGRLGQNHGMMGGAPWSILKNVLNDMFCSCDFVMKQSHESDGSY